MYGNDTLPGVAVSPAYRNKGTIWQGEPETTWFKTVCVNSSEEQASTIEAGTIMKELADGSYSPIAESDIVSNVNELPSVRLTVVADKNAKTGTTAPAGESEDAAPEAVPSTVLVGVCGKVDKSKLLVGSKHFSELSDSQQISLNLQLEAWNFLLLNVLQA